MQLLGMSEQNVAGQKAGPLALRGGADDNAEAVSADEESGQEGCLSSHIELEGAIEVSMHPRHICTGANRSRASCCMP